MQAIVTRLFRSPVIQRLPVPKLEVGEVLIKVASCSINPTDYKTSAISLGGKIVGCDFSGTVSATAADVTNLKAGDRVAGVVHGCKTGRTGAFAQYVAAPAALCWRIPARYSFEEMCTFGVGWATSVLALEDKLEPLAKIGRDNEGQTLSPLLVYSGASSTGMQAIQLSRLRDPKRVIIALASERNHDLLRKLGASHTISYQGSIEDVSARVRHVSSEITMAIDCFSSGKSGEVIRSCLSASKAGMIVFLLPPPKAPNNSRIKHEWVLAYTITGEAFRFLYYKSVPARPQDLQLASRWFSRLGEALESGDVIPVPHRVIDGGLSGVNEAFSLHKKGAVSGTKLVISLK